jgi:glyoxylase-like metal-dependent hydrolase (beta-lactamase superfamily II)
MAGVDAGGAVGAEETPAPVLSGSPTEIADGVYVIPDGRVPLVPNVGIVVGSRDALVVDTAMGPRNGGTVRRFAEDLAAGRPLLLTITHFHPEHGFGAQAFLPGATIVYNRDQLGELQEKGQSYVEMFKTFGPGVAAELEGVELVEPQVVYDGEADVDLGRKAVQLRTWGLAHTRGDQVVFLPDERILFTGDLVENRFFPIFPYFPPGDADVDGSRWIAVLEQLERLEPAIVVPGHGEVGDAGLIGAVRECIAALRAETRRLVGQGLGVDEIVAELEPAFRGRYPDWGQPEWIGFAARSFYAAEAT